jgi:hypothetical protein
MNEKIAKIGLKEITEERDFNRTKVSLKIA